MRTPSGLHAREVSAFIASRVKAALRPLAFRPKGVGVAVAGQVDVVRGIVRSAPNLDWRGLPLRRELQRILGLPVVLENDARAAAVAEATRGAGRGVADFLLVLVGTGVGGGIVTGGRLVRGATGTAGEIGHLKLFAAGRTCRCGGRGCLEAYVGGRRLAGRGVPRTAAPLLGAAIAGLVNVLNPRLVILGGGLLDASPRLRREAVEVIHRTALPAALVGLRFARPALGNRAGAIGAADIARIALGASA